MQIIICRNGLGHYQLIASMHDLKFQSSVHHPTIQRPSIIGTLSVVVLSISPPNIFLPEALHGTLGKLCMLQCLSCLTPRVAMPQLHKELCTLSVEVSFTHVPTHVLNMKSKNNNIAL